MLKYCKNLKPNYILSQETKDSHNQNIHTDGIFKNNSIINGKWPPSSEHYISSLCIMQFRHILAREKNQNKELILNWFHLSR